jgi:hypothetical protein
MRGKLVNSIQTSFCVIKRTADGTTIMCGRKPIKILFSTLFNQKISRFSFMQMTQSAVVAASVCKIAKIEKEKLCDSQL